MPTKRTAASILEARGAFRKDPGRRRVEPKGKAAFPRRAPGGLTPEQAKCWHTLVKSVPAGVLTGSDQAAVYLAACLWAQFTEDPAGMPTARIAQLRAALGNLGLSPTDRARLQPQATVEEW